MVDQEAHDKAKSKFIDDLRDEALALADDRNRDVLRYGAGNIACLCVTALIAMECTYRCGSSVQYVLNFIVGVDDLELMIEELGGFEHPAMASFASAHRSLLRFANQLLDLMIAGEF